MSLTKKQHGKIINKVASNAGAGALTKDIDTGDAAGISFNVFLTQNSATALVATLWSSNDGGQNYARVPSVSIETGAGTVSDYTMTKSVSASDTVSLQYNCQNDTHVRIVVSATGGGGSDYLTVTCLTSSYTL